MPNPPETNPANNNSSNPLDKVNWDLLLDNIERGECVVCLGPGVFSEKNGKTLEQKLADHLRSQKDTLNIRVYDDGWYHFLDKRQWAQTWYAIKKFYEQPTPDAERVFAKLAALRLSLMVSLTPDYKLREAVHQSRGEGNYIFGSYIKKEDFKSLEMPTPDKPLVYNLLGEIGQKVSIVHTYEDMYQYLESVFEGKSMPPKLREKLETADHYLFIGLPFDRWYMHLFLHILKQNDFIGRTKYAPALNVLNEIEEQYNITFVETQTIDFVEELYKRCEARNLIYKPANVPNDQPGPAAPQIATNPAIAALKKLVADDEINEAFMDFKEFIISTFDIDGIGRDLMNSIILEESNFTRLQRALRKAEITQAEFEHKLINVKSKLLEYMDDAQKLLNQQK